MTAISKSSPIGFRSGDPINVLDPVNRLPEEIEATKPLLPRVLTVKSEEMFAWRQLLGTFQRMVQTSKPAPK